MNYPIPRYQTNSLVDESFIESSPTEPITLAQAKGQLLVDFTDDDTNITALITECRKGVEKFCKVSLVTKTVVVVADLYTELELPWGPVTAFTKAELKTGIGSYTTMTANSDYETDGVNFLRFNPLVPGRWKLTYTAGGFAGVEDLVLDLKRIIAYCYQNKGDEEISSPRGGVMRPKAMDDALELFAGKHVRMCWI